MFVVKREHKQQREGENNVRRVKKLRGADLIMAVKR